MTLEEAVKQIEQLQSQVQSLDERTRRCERVREYVLVGGVVVTIAVAIVFGLHPRDVAREIATAVATEIATVVATEVGTDVAEDVATSAARRVAEKVAAQEATIALPLLEDKVKLIVRELVPEHVRLEVNQRVPVAVTDAVKASTDKTVLEDIQQQRETAKTLVDELKKSKAALTALQMTEQGDIEIRGKLNVIGGPITVSGLNGRERAGISGNSFSLDIEDRQVSRIDNAGGDGNLYLSFGDRRLRLSASKDGDPEWQKQ